MTSGSRKGHLTNGDRLRIGRVELKVERQTRKPPRNLSSRRSALRRFVLTVPGEKRIRSALLPDRRAWPVPGVHLGIIAKREKHRPNRSNQRVVIAAWQVRPSASNRRTAYRRRAACRRRYPSTQPAGRRRRDNGLAYGVSRTCTFQTQWPGSRYRRRQSAAAAAR